MKPKSSKPASLTQAFFSQALFRPAVFRSALFSLTLFMTLALGSGLGLAAQSGATGADGAEALAILKKADLALIPANAEFRFSLRYSRPGEEDSLDSFLSFKKGDLKYLFFTYAPDSSYGQCHLRIDSTIWTYFPLADESYKSSYKSAFLGSGLSYADVMYNELSRYYDANILERGIKVRGLDSESDCVKLELSARKGADGYARIVCSIDSGNFLTLRRDYYTKSGELLKTILFGGFKSASATSGVQAFNLEVTDALDPGAKTFGRFWEMKAVKEVPEKYFSLAFIKTWQPAVKE